MGLLENEQRNQRKTTPLSNSSFILFDDYFEILKHVKYVSCQIFICFVTSNKKLDLTSVSVLRIHHFFFFFKQICENQKMKGLKSQAENLSWMLGVGLSCGFTVSPWSGGCLTIPVSSLAVLFRHFEHWAYLIWRNSSIPSKTRRELI